MFGRLERKQREAYEEGFRDALIHGARNPTMGGDDTWHYHYGRGFDDGDRAVSRIVSLVTTGIGGR